MIALYTMDSSDRINVMKPFFEYINLEVANNKDYKYSMLKTCLDSIRTLYYSVSFIK